MGKTKNEIIRMLGFPNRQGIGENQMMYEFNNKEGGWFLLKDGKVYSAVLNVICDSYPETRDFRNNFMSNLSDRDSWKVSIESSSTKLSNSDINVTIFLTTQQLYDGTGRYNFLVTYKEEVPSEIKKEETISVGKHIDKKHHFIFKYPKDQFVFYKSESSVEDTTFLSDLSSGIIILTVVDIPDGRSLQDFYDEELTRQPEASYKVINVKKNFFVVSSIQNDKVIYLRAKQSGNVIIKYRVSYPADDKAYYDPMLNEISVVITK